MSEEAMSTEQRREPPLDAEMAEQVMGWILTGRELGGTLNRRTVYEWRDSNGVIVAYPDGWSPTARIAHAWMVIERARELGVFVTIENTATSWRVIAGRAGTNEEGVFWTDFDFTGPEAPPLICEAVLAALADLDDLPTLAALQSRG